MKLEVIKNEDGYIFKIPKDFMIKNIDWRFTLLLELSLMNDIAKWLINAGYYKLKPTLREVCAYESGYDAGKSESAGLVAEKSTSKVPSIIEIMSAIQEGMNNYDNGEQSGKGVLKYLISKSVHSLCVKRAKGE